MPEEQRAVQSIKNFLQYDSEVELEELVQLSQHYAELCEQTNERLRRCEHYLRNGMRAEAIHLAEEAPPVLESAAALYFHGVEAWEEVCRSDRRLSLASPIAVDVVSWLNQAYMQEGSLEAVMTEYRRLQHSGTSAALPQKIAVLRRLVEMDPDDAAHWRRDLREFEHARLDQIAAGTKRASEGDDLETLEALRTELTSGEWLKEPDRRLATELDRQILRVRRKRAAARGRRLARDAWNAYGAFDYAGAGSALRGWDALLEEGDFSPPEDLAAHVDEVREWFEIEQKKAADERDFQRALGELTAALDERNLRLDELERLYFAVTRHNRQLQPALQRRAEQAIRDARHARERTRRLIIAACVVGVVIVAVPTFLLVRGQIRQRWREQWVAQIQTAYEQASYDAAAQLMDDLKGQHPDIAAEPGFHDWGVRIEAGKAQFQAERQRCERILTQLEQIAGSGFPDDRPYAELEQRAGELVATPQEQARFDTWLLAKEEHEARLQKERDDRFNEHLAAAMACFTALAELDPEQDQQQYRELLDQAESHLNNAGAVPAVSEALAGRLPSLERNLITQRTALRDAIQRAREQRALLARIEKAPPDLAAYQGVVKEFVDRFPDHPEADRFGRLLALIEVGIDLERGADWKVAYDKRTAGQIREFLASPAGKRSVWREDLEWLQGQIGAAPRAAIVLANLRRLRENPRLYSLRELQYEDTATGQSRHCYFIDYVQEGPQISSGGKKIANYLVDVFEDGIAPVTRELTMPVLPEDPDELLAPHCKLFRELYRKVTAADPADCEAILLRAAEELRAHPDVDPVVKAILLLELVNQAKILNPGSADRINPVLQRLATANTNVNWMAPEPDTATRDVREDISMMLEGLRELPELALDRLALDSVHRRSLSRNPRCVGRVTIRRGGLSFEVVGGPYPELWTALPDEAQGATVLVAARGAPADYRPAESLGTRPIEGAPVFAPGDGKSTPEVLEEIVQDLPPGGRAALTELDWPPSWPANARQLGAVAQGDGHAR